MKRKLNVQLWTAVLLTVCGVVMLYCGFWVAPRGEIHNSVLVAFGEISTFAGALFGVDYTYRFKRYLNENDIKNKQEKDEEN